MAQLLSRDLEDRRGPPRTISFIYAYNLSIIGHPDCPYCNFTMLVYSVLPSWKRELSSVSLPGIHSDYPK